MFGFGNKRREKMRGDFLSAMSRVASTVSIVTTTGPNGLTGATVSAMSSVSADGPRPTLLICLHQGGNLGREVLRNGGFCVNVLDESQSAIADVFAGRSDHTHPQRFEVGEWFPMADGSPGLVGSIVQLSCRVAASERVGTHDVIFGAVHEILLGDNKPPLIYASRNYSRTQPLYESAPVQKST